MVGGRMHACAGVTGILNYDIKFREPTPKSIAFVSAFAKHTGDFAGLSPVDLRVLALAHTFTVERNGGGSINELPEVNPKKEKKKEKKKTK